jgi:hypothetical protein
MTACWRRARVTVPGRLSTDLQPGTLKRPALRTDPNRYAVVIEKGEHNYSAYVADLPGCVAVGDTLEDVIAAPKRRFGEKGPKIVPVPAFRLRRCFA